MKILHLIASVDPVGGGPIEYARLMAEKHESLGHSCSFVSLDTADDAFLLAFPFQVYCAGGQYDFLASTRYFGRKVAEIAKDYDVAVVHGLWNAATIGGYHALKNAQLPWVIFTHGMLDPYFRQTKPVKHWLKQVFWAMWQGRLLSEAQSVLFTCEGEKLAAQKAFLGHQNYKSKVVAFCASDLCLLGIDLEEGTKSFQAAVPALNGREYLLFLSRIHPKKACDNLIEAYAQVAAKFPEIDLVFAGPDQTEWQKELVQLSRQLCIEKRVHWAGMIQGATKSAAFSGAKAFTLPSHQENFGLVVAEALSTGTPVLISDKVNIWKEIINDGAGLVGSDDVEATADVLKYFLELTEEEVVNMENVTRPCYEKNFSVKAASADLLKELERVVHGREGQRL